jgi:hypothetical protein
MKKEFHCWPVAGRTGCEVDPIVWTKIRQSLDGVAC